MDCATILKVGIYIYYRHWIQPGISNPQLLPLITEHTLGFTYGKRDLDIDSIGHFI